LAVPSADQKIGYAYGFVDGTLNGMGATLMPTPALASREDLVRAMALWRNTQSRFKPDFTRGVTVGQLIDAVDLFYNDPANRRIEWSSAVVLSVGRINGASQAELDRAIESARKSAAK
jgi:hypothetical protein